MKCKKCGGRAQIDLPSHNIALCREDFLAFFKRRVERAAHDFKLFGEGERILVAVSGGKDSLALLHVLNDLGYPLAGLYINLGIPGYSDESAGRCAAFSQAFGIDIHAFSIESFFGMPVQALARIVRRDACSVCGVVKRYVMNRYALDTGFSCLATGHNLDDESAAALGNLINIDTGRLAKEKMLLPAAPGVVKKVKPFTFISEKEAAAYALMQGIDYIHDECPHARGATSLVYKQALSVIERNSPGTKVRLLKNVMDRGSLFREHKVEESGEGRFCDNCGARTWEPLCGFCKLADRASVRERAAGDLSQYVTKL